MILKRTVGSPRAAPSGPRTDERRAAEGASCVTSAWRGPPALYVCYATL